MISASKLDLYAYCPGAYRLGQLAPKRPSGDAAREGIAAALLAETSLAQGAHPLQFVGQEMAGVTVTAEMATHIGEYCRICREFAAGGTMGVEVKRRNESEHLSGICDFECHANGVLTIMDLKYGYGWVEVYDNWQLLAYLTLWYRETRHIPNRIRLAIYQPRANHPDGPLRTWEFNGELIRAHSNYVGNAVAEALKEDAPCVAGIKCRYCPAIVGCDSNKRLVSECMSVATEATYQEMDPQMVSAELSRIEFCHNVIQHRRTALEEYAAATIEGGTPIPGYGYDSKPGPLKWTGDAIAQGDALGVDLRAPDKPLTPTQAINKKLLPEQTVKCLAKREQGAPRLTRVNLAGIRKKIQQANKGD